ncbi:MAG: hypothetical protein HKN03_02030 [Acidimicrobiales bacterium]|nr:hypothetical protein [Acidimicrobiales bacterium]
MARSPKHRTKSGRGARPEIGLLDDNQGSAEIYRERLQRTSGKRLRPLIFALVILAVPALIAGAIVAIQNADPPSESAAPAQPSDDELGDPLVTPEPRERDALEDFSANGGELQLGNRFASIAAAMNDVALTAAIDSRPGTGILYGPVGDLGVRVLEPAGLTHVKLDSSGNWVAGTYRNSFDQDVLVVGRADVLDVGRTVQSHRWVWELEPMAVGTNGFVWHPHAPGLLAYAENNLTKTTLVTVRDLTTERPGTRRYHIDLPGRLAAWGDWGFGFNEPGPFAFTSVAIPPEEETATGINELTPVVTGVRGNPLGIIAERRLLIDGGQTAAIVNLDTGAMESNEWFEPDQEVLAFRASPDGKFSVGLLADRGQAPNAGGRVVLFAANPSSVVEATEQIFTTSGATTFDWDGTGRFVAGHQSATTRQNGQRGSAASITVFDLERALHVSREIRTHGGEFDDNLPMAIDSLAFREQLPD